MAGFRPPLFTENSEKSYYSAMGKLPAVGDLDIEMQWVAAHPAMSRKDRSLEPDARIIINREDILNAPHGPAPSRRAVQSLQHWCNDPREFQKILLAEYKEEKKKLSSAAKGDTSEEVIDNLEEAERILAQYT
jgi:hypothetical protein